LNTSLAAAGAELYPKNLGPIYGFWWALKGTTNFHAFHVWEKHIVYEVAMIQHFSFTFFHFFGLATQLFSTPVTSSNLHNQAQLFTELRLLQGIPKT